MGLLSLAGVGRGMADVADQNTKRWAEEDLTRLREEMEEKKMMAVQRIAQQARAEQGQRLFTAQQGLLTKATEDNARTFYGSDPAPKVDSMIDEEKQQFAPSDKQRMDALIQAGLQTGDINPYQAAESMRKTEADMYRSAYQASEQQRKLEQGNRALDIREATSQNRGARYDEKAISRERDKFAKPGTLGVPQFLKMNNPDAKTDPYAVTASEELFDKLVDRGMAPDAAKTTTLQMIAKAQSEAAKANIKEDDYSGFIGQSLKRQLTERAKPQTPKSNEGILSPKTPTPAPKTPSKPPVNDRPLPEGVTEHKVLDGKTVYKLGAQIFNSREDLFQFIDANEARMAQTRNAVGRTFGDADQFADLQ